MSAFVADTHQPATGLADTFARALASVASTSFGRAVEGVIEQHEAARRAQLALATRDRDAALEAQRVAARSEREQELGLLAKRLSEAHAAEVAALRAQLGQQAQQAEGDRKRMRLLLENAKIEVRDMRALCQESAQVHPG